MSAQPWQYRRSTTALAGGVLTGVMVAGTNAVPALTPAAQAATTYKGVSITIDMQEWDNWCAPASSQATLTAFGVSKTQTYLAGKEKTGPVNTSKGTLAANVPPVLNALESRNSYQYSRDLTSGAQLFTRAKVNLNPSGSYRAPLIPDMQAAVLPDWKKYGQVGRHAIVIYGYGSDNSTLQIFDPIDDVRMYGRRLVSATTIYNGIRDLDNSGGAAGNGGLIW